MDCVTDSLFEDTLHTLLNVDSFVMLHLSRWRCKYYVFMLAGVLMAFQSQQNIISHHHHHHQCLSLSIQKGFRFHFKS